MQRQEIMEWIKGYIVQNILEGESDSLIETTPLLEWGILSSFEIVKLLGAIEKQFGIEVPGDQIVAEHFINLTAITDLVLATSQERH